jgi:hypothetical protein
MRTGASLLKMTVAVAVFATVSSAMAQGGGGGRGRGGFQVNPITLAKVEGVQKDLELSGEQKDSLGKLEVEQVDFAAMRDLSPEDRLKKTTEIRTAAQKKVDDILAPPQRDRFAQILLQVDGVAALRQPKVAEKLKLTDEQKTKLNELFAARQGGGGGGGGGGGQAAREERDAKALEILTADQKTQYTSMQGKKIEIDRAALFGGFGGGGGGGRQGKGKKGPDA